MAHSPTRVVSCLMKHGITAKIKPKRDLAGDLDFAAGRVAAHLGAARVDITIFAKGSAGDHAFEDVAVYHPAQAAPRRLVEAVWICVGRTSGTTPSSCPQGVCTYFYP